MFGFFRLFVTGRSTGRTIVAVSDSSSLVDLPLVSVPSLFLVGGSVRLLGNSSSELDRVGFGSVLAFFVADGVTLLFFQEVLKH
jgi:hypothetical protein